MAIPRNFNLGSASNADLAAWSKRQDKAISGPAKAERRTRLSALTTRVRGRGDPYAKVNAISANTDAVLSRFRAGAPRAATAAEDRTAGS